MADPVRGHRRRYILVLMALTALTLATLDQGNQERGPVGAAGRAAHHVVQPISDAASSVFSPIHDWWHGLWHHGDIVAENRRLRRELQQELAKIQAHDFALEQLQKYEQFFGQTYWRNYKSVGATVVGDSPGNNETTVTINRGTEHGLRAGMAVVGPLGLIGTIEQTWSGGSKVLLISDPTFGVAARTLVDNHFTTAHTDAEGVLRLTFATNGQPRNLDIRPKVGDEIVTCGCAGSTLPPGIPIGAVTSVSVAFDGSYVSVAVEPTLDRPSLEIVKAIVWSPGNAVPSPVVGALAKRSTTTTRKPPASTTTTTTKGH